MQAELITEDPIKGANGMTGKVLFYTIAIDLDGLKLYSQQARMLVSSLKHSGFQGDIKIIHNGERPIFDYPHPQVEEICIDTPGSFVDCYTAKYKARHLLSVDDYDWVVFLDTDFVVNSSLSTWFEGPEVIRFVTESTLTIQHDQFNAYLTEVEMKDLKQMGVSSGTFVIKAEFYNEVMAEWEAIDARIGYDLKWGDQPAWNRLILDTRHSKKILSEPSVDFYYKKWDLMGFLNAPVVHFCGCGNGQKILAMQAKFITHFHTDDEGSLLRMLER